MSEPDRNRIPRHVAIIMDGNGRWAKQRTMNRLKGHEAGAESVRAAIHACKKHGVEYLTLYAFSVENWVRPRAEIQGLMLLLRRFLKEQEFELHENQVRLRVIGRLDDLDDSIRAELDRVVTATEAYTQGQLILALSYGGRAEIADACRKIASRAVDGDLDVDSIDEETIADHLYLPDVPDPDLMIRTSGEMRISNFLLWQLSYAELYVTDVLWPDFREEDLALALDSYANRKRRFGDVEERDGISG